jgi:hypothetical protein
VYLKTEIAQCPFIHIGLIEILIRLCRSPPPLLA